MKTEIVKEKKHELIEMFPLVAMGVASKDVILFKNETSGTVINGDSNAIGDHCTTWINCFNKEYWQILDSVTITFES